VLGARGKEKGEPFTQAGMTRERAPSRGRAPALNLAASKIHKAVEVSVFGWGGSTVLEFVRKRAVKGGKGQGISPLLTTSTGHWGLSAYTEFSNLLPKREGVQKCKAGPGSCLLGGVKWLSGGEGKGEAGLGVGAAGMDFDGVGKSTQVLCLEGQKVGREPGRDSGLAGSLG